MPHVSYIIIIIIIITTGDVEKCSVQTANKCDSDITDDIDEDMVNFQFVVSVPNSTSFVETVNLTHETTHMCPLRSVLVVDHHVISLNLANLDILFTLIHA